VTLNGTTSAAARGRTIQSYSWTVVSGPSDVTIANASLATASVEAPGTGTATIRLTVTDNAGRSDTATLPVGGTSGGGGGGGGGGTDGATLAALLGLALLRHRTTRTQR
jgi:hypothetical protein